MPDPKYPTPPDVPSLDELARRLALAEQHNVSWERDCKSIAANLDQRDRELAVAEGRAQALQAALAEQRAAHAFRGDVVTTQLLDDLLALASRPVPPAHDRQEKS